jgi:hypothetical protein
LTASKSQGDHDEPRPAHPRFAAVLAGLAAALVAPAFAVPPPPHDGPAGTPVPPAGVHTVVVGGTPGGQIALIAIGAALFAATAAVLLDRARSTRRNPATAT